MKRDAVIVWLAVIGTAVALSGERLSTPLLDDAVVGCATCRVGVEQMWRAAERLRRECQHADNETEWNDDCAHGNVQQERVAEVVRGACDQLPRRFQATHDEIDGFKLSPQDAPQHVEAVSVFLTNRCTEWITHSHDIERVALLIFANVDAGKDEHHVLMPLQHRFCEAACGFPKRAPRGRLHPRKRHGHVDFSYALQVEAARAKTVDFVEAQAELSTNHPAPDDDDEF
jgi:hypothetical protein